MLNTFLFLYLAMILSDYEGHYSSRDGNFFGLDSMNSIQKVAWIVFLLWFVYHFLFFGYLLYRFVIKRFFV